MKVLMIGISVSSEFNKWPLVSLGAGYLVAYAKKDPYIQEHIDIEFLSCLIGISDADDRDDENLLQQIMGKKPDIAAFSCYPWNIEKISHVSNILKTVAPDTVIIWGGPEVGFIPLEVLRRYPFVDIVVRGEGEITFTQLLKTLHEKRGELSDISGIACRKGDNIIATPARPPLSRLDDIPSPYLTGVLDPETKRGQMSIESFRSCPYRCGFCSSPGHPRFFSMERIRKEIEYGFEKDLDSILFIDPYLNIDGKRLAQIADIFHGISPTQKKIGACFIMADRLTDKMVADLSRMNIVLAKTGLQTTNPVVLKNIDLRLNEERFRKSIRLMQDHGIRVLLQLIAGLPGDTLEGLKRSLDFTIGLRPDSIACYSALLLHGSSLYDRRNRFQIRFDERPPHRIFSHYSLSYREMLECLEFAYDVCNEYNRADKRSRGGIKIGDLEAWREETKNSEIRRFFGG
jgi:radical SAM superfamily enzyme YgiQ (UPF0313 family)